MGQRLLLTRVPALQEIRNFNRNNTRDFFKVPKGKKEVWLPDFMITLLRTTYLPPHMACFQVPLNMNKLDMRDYMWNVYKVPVIKVRSYIQGQKVVMNQGSSKDPIPLRGRMYRPQSTKRMIIEMVDVGEHGGSFVWPDPIKDFTEWSKEAHDETDKAETNETEYQIKISQRSKDNAKALREQAHELLSGHKQWKPNVPIYSRTEATV